MLATLALIGLVLQTLAMARSGPDTDDLCHAMERVDLATRRRVAVLDRLEAKGLITRSEYFRHVVRVLSDGDKSKARKEAPAKTRSRGLPRTDGTVDVSSQGAGEQW